MTDITTIEEVQAGEYTVRVAQTDDGQAWEAVVLSDDGDSPDRLALAGMFALGVSHTATDDSDDDAPLGMPVTAPHRWVAIGFAIEAYEWGEVGEEPVDVDAAYETGEYQGRSFIETFNTDEVNGESVSVESVDLDTDAEFPGPWSPEEGDG